MIVLLVSSMVHASTKMLLCITTEFSCLPFHEARAMYHYIALGNVMQNDFYRDLSEPKQTADIAPRMKI